MNGAGGVCDVRGVYLHAVVARPVKELRGRLVGLLALYEPPLYLGDGVAYHLAMQLGAVVEQLGDGEGRLDEARCVGRACVNKELWGGGGFEQSRVISWIGD